MKDLIDKRNEREKIGRSIIKSWNVNYTQMPLQVNSDEAEEKDMEPQKGQDNTYNKTTGSNSGLYGQQEVDSVSKDQIDKILQEKKDAFRDMVENELK